MVPTGEPFCKSLCTPFHPHAWLDYWGSGMTTGHSGPHRGPNTLPTQTMMTSCSALWGSETDVRDQNRTAHVFTHCVWALLVCVPSI